jgi:hypothetical protein
VFALLRARPPNYPAAAGAACFLFFLGGSSSRAPCEANGTCSLERSRRRRRGPATAWDTQFRGGRDRPAPPARRRNFVDPGYSSWSRCVEVRESDDACAERVGFFAGSLAIELPSSQERSNRAIRWQLCT